MVKMTFNSTPAIDHTTTHPTHTHTHTSPPIYLRTSMLMGFASYSSRIFPLGALGVPG